MSEDSTPHRRPDPDEVDVFGLTHRGWVREENQDHFLVGTLTDRDLEVSSTSLPEPPHVERGVDPPVFLAMVADGVGGGPRGEEASRLTVAGVTRYLSESLQAVRSTEGENGGAFARTLSEAAIRCAHDLWERGETDHTARGMATTLSLWVGIWPRAYLLQVGDSRYYVLRDGELSQVSRDQTLAQELVDQGVVTANENPRLANTLSSAIGGTETRPVVTPADDGWGVVHLLCSDGLTKHVPDARIKEMLGSMTSARQVAEDLVQAALDGGGSDNVTVVVARAMARE